MRSSLQPQESQELRQQEFYSANAIRNYLNDVNRKEVVLAAYAPKLRVERKVMEILGIWL